MQVSTFGLLLRILLMISANGNGLKLGSIFFPVLINIPSPHPLVDMADRCSWKDMEGNLCHFRSWDVWNTLRHRGDRVDWVDSIWFSQCIPRHSFHMWLVMTNKLKTQDRMATWEAGSTTNLILMCCPLCYHDRDSRDHLFFQCSFATKVWEAVRKMVNMESVNNTWSSVMQWMIQNTNSRTLDRIVGKILIAATSYYVWQERNNRLFSSVQRSPEMLSHVIISTVRLKIMGFKLRSDRKHRDLLDTWQISVKSLDCDPG
ncbi:uncharacterized protein LOC110943250 [Helianthus annuus]|uniref:uncharacterized protein LOC110943250 n=1 Tax=Helianthus annuus TaxID=4232 RepID=UPI000B902C75|nr:uncharacterized protein LOC110943250 [Helianthus annuus]